MYVLAVPSYVVCRITLGAGTSLYNGKTNLSFQKVTAMVHRGVGSIRKCMARVAAETDQRKGGLANPNVSSHPNLLIVAHANLVCLQRTKGNSIKLLGRYLFELYRNQSSDSTIRAAISGVMAIKDKGWLNLVSHCV